MTDNTQPEALQCAADLEYSIPRHRIQDAFILNAYKALKMVRTQHARITELESQLAQRFDAADMATAAAQGFRDGAAEVAKLKGQRMVLCSLLGECLPVIDVLMQLPGDDDSDAHLNGLMARVGDALVAIAEDQVKGGES